MKPITVIIIGPTGVGKTDFVHALGAMCPIEIINGDMGQMYAPLSIGTAKPDLAHVTVPHFLFDILTTPVLFSAMKFRARVVQLVAEIQSRNHIPVIVGGSSFYLFSLFFPAHPHPSAKTDTAKENNLWQQLHRIDPKRAAHIEPHDKYRLERAIAIWHATGVKPSEYEPAYDPFGPACIVWLERDRSQLYERINARVLEMIESGWVQEVQNLQDSEWEPFLKKKKLIGYDILFSYLSGDVSREEMVAMIQKKTRNYAKRQITFWNSFKRKLQEGMRSQSRCETPVEIREFSLTHGTVESYIKQLKSEICS